tara:strand:- start:552 stop:794 length:243 start_codon:yes stop_codon:yes gene_type:complete
MPPRVNVSLKSDSEISDFDFYAWWKALVDKGIPPSEAWQMDFIETSIILDLEHKATDTTLALYHQRKANGASGKWLTQNH